VLDWICAVVVGPNAAEPQDADAAKRLRSRSSSAFDDGKADRLDRTCGSPSVSSIRRVHGRSASLTCDSLPPPYSLDLVDCGDAGRSPPPVLVRPIPPRHPLRQRRESRRRALLQRFAFSSFCPFSLSSYPFARELGRTHATRDTTS
jgi:hypothetical protein